MIRVFRKTFSGWIHVKEGTWVTVP